MFNNVIVGVDGREGGRDALALAKVLRRQHGEITLAHVHPGDSFTWRGSTPAYELVEEADSRALLEREESEAGVTVHTRMHAASSVGRGLHELAEEIGADLIVVGSSHSGLLGRVLLHDHTREALGGAPCAVATAPAGYSRQATVPREVGVGYDGSRESEHAVGVARRLADELGATLSGLQAVFLPAYMTAGASFPDQESIDAMLEGARERVEALGDIEARAAFGLPVEELAVFSGSLDLLVIGSRSYGPLGRLVHGSTARALARSARCPLLVLPRGAGQDAESSSAVDHAATSAPASA